MPKFEKNKPSFMEKRKKELENAATDMEMEDFTSPLNVRKPDNKGDEESGNAEVSATEQNLPKESESKDISVNNQESVSGKSGGEPEKKKAIIRKTIAIEEDVFMQLQLLKAYHRLDHQDVIAMAVKEFLKRHTENGRIKDSDLKSVMKMAGELKK